MTQTLNGYNAATRMVHVKRLCGCEAEISVKGIKEARQAREWLAGQKCRQCEQEKKGN